MNAPVLPKHIIGTVECWPGKHKTYGEMREASDRTRAAYIEAVEAGGNIDAAWAAYRDARADLDNYRDDLAGTDEWIGCRPKREVMREFDGVEAA